MGTVVEAVGLLADRGPRAAEGGARWELQRMDQDPPLCPLQPVAYDLIQGE